MAEDLTAWGAPAELQAEFAEADDDYFPLDPRNARTVRLFLAVRTQWVVGPAGGVIGLNYSGVDVAIRRLNLKVDAGEFARLQVMERAVVSAIAEKMKDARDD